MKKWVLPAAGAAAVLIAAAGAAFALAGGFDANDGETEQTARSDNGPGGELQGGVAAACTVDVPDCNDTIAVPVDGSPVPDNPVPFIPGDPISAFPLTSIDNIDPNECSLVHNITACQRAAIEAAIAEFSQRSGVPASEISAVDAQFVEWPDACLGVQDPNIACAQVITPGYRVTLDTGVIAPEYHTDLNGRAVLAVPGQ
ncbi:MAG: hypothetical protein Q7T33_14545 [Dehalococcoidia bacterium]|nr:hypothetical protein [Dehalococcoidia bacterium]